MKSTHPEPLCRFISDQFPYALLHFCRSLVGECQSENIRCGDALPEKPGNTAGKDPGLAGTCPRDYESGAVDLLYGLLLCLVQVIEKVFRNHQFYSLSGKRKITLLLPFLQLKL